MALKTDKSKKAITPHISRQSGFTLMEMMIVIAVIAIGAAIAIPAFTSMLPGMRLNGAARQIAADLMAARMSAVKENNKYRVLFNSPSTNQYQILDDDNNNNSADDNELITTKYIQTEGNSNAQKYYDVTFTSNINPIFTPRGTANSIGSITLTNPSGSKVISVILSGRVQIQ